MRKRRAALPLSVIGAWRPATYLVATPYGPNEEAGRTHAAGLGMKQLWRGSPKGRRPPVWNLTHLGSGHRICIIEAHEAEAFVLADQIAALTDWDFDGLEGWRNLDPDLMEKLAALFSQHPKITRTGGPQSPYGDQVAREIAMARAA